MKKIVKSGILVILSVLVVVVLAACDDDSGEFPSRRVSIYVPFSAGGGTDLVARGMAEAARDAFPSGVAVENRTGAGGAVGITAGANASATGYTLTTLTVESVTLPHMGGVEFGRDSFIPIIMLNEAYSVITVHANSDFYTLDDLISASAQNSILVGNSGVGAIWHLAAAAFAEESGASFEHVPFEGATDAITSLLGEHIDAVTVSFPEVVGQVEAGELRVLAILGPDRIEEIPDVPTASELGFDVQVSAWRGMGVPAGTPQEVVDTLYEIFSEAAGSDYFIDFMENNNLSINIMNPQEFAARMERDDALFGELITNLGLAE